MSLKKAFTWALNDFCFRNARHIVGRLSTDGSEVEHKETVLGGAYTVEIKVTRNHSYTCGDSMMEKQTNIFDITGEKSTS